MSMRLAFLTVGPCPYYHDFCELLGRTTDLTVIYERRFLGNRDESWAGVETAGYQTVWLKGVNVGDEMAFCPGILWYLRKNRFDLVILHDYLSPTGMLASLYMRAYHIPFAIHADGGVKKEREKVCIRLLKNFFASKACAYFSSGRITDEYFTYYGADVHKIYRYPFTSVHADEILTEPLSGQEKRKLREELGLGKQIRDGRLVLYVGSIIHRKGVDLLLRCAKRVGEGAEFLIVGGEATTKMKQWIRRHGITNVTFRGFEPPEQIRKYMRCADLFVFPTRYDIWGLVINEAMAAGLPVVTTDRCVAGMELVEDGKNGRVVHANDVDALTEGVLKMLHPGQQEQAEIGRNNLGKIRTYSLEHMAQVYESQLRELVKNFKGNDKAWITTK